MSRDSTIFSRPPSHRRKCSASVSATSPRASLSIVSMPLSFKALVKHVLYALKRPSHSSFLLLPRRYFSEYHFKKHVSYFSFTSLHSGARDADMATKGLRMATQRRCARQIDNIPEVMRREDVNKLRGCKLHLWCQVTPEPVRWTSQPAHVTFEGCRPSRCEKKGGPRIVFLSPPSMSIQLCVTTYIDVDTLR